MGKEPPAVGAGSSAGNHAGLRASEVGKLELRDYDPKADRILIHRLKGSHSGHHILMREDGRTLRA